MKKTIILLALVLAVAAVPGVSRAEGQTRQPSLEIVLYDSLVGAGIGALAGTATLAFMDHPSDHLNRIAQGAAIGVLCGMAYGVYEIRPVLYSYRSRDGSQEVAYGLNFSFKLK
jgi:hypothetical protein